MSNAEDIVRSMIEKPTVFKNREALYPEYLPEKLPHREQQLASLTNLFRGLLVSPGSFSQRVLLVGGLGTGKTVTARLFGTIFSAAAREHGIELRYVHVNCHRERTLFGIVTEIARQLGLPIPPRGLSAQEIYYGIMDYLDRKDVFLLTVLDEFDYFVEVSGSDAVYFLIRTYDEYPERAKRLNFILISRDPYVVHKLDNATASYLVRNTVRFNKYTSREIYDILDHRRSIAFYDGVVSDEVLEFISEIVGADREGDGNARLALEMLLMAGLAADEEMSPRVTIDHVRKANALINTSTVVALEHLPFLSRHELLLLLAAVNVLRKEQTSYVRIGDVEREYQALCEEYKERPRRHTQVYEYVMNLKKLGLIEARTSGKGYRGKSTLIGITAAPLRILEDKIREMLETIKE